MSGTETRRLTRTTTLRLSEAEVEALRLAADERGLGPSALARVLVLRGIGLPGTARGRRSELSRSVAAVLGELGRIGSNLNQLARVANTSGDASALASAAAVQGELRLLTEAVLALSEPPT